MIAVLDERDIVGVDVHPQSILFEGSVHADFGGIEVGGRDRADDLRGTALLQTAQADLVR
jgi:hypothetical protein